uniref:Cyclin N-terminal domain-containing protein n=1 Tax=Myotis lucifugus TaxID=59463 RepID=G1Q494_MYOLU
MGNSKSCCLKASPSPSASPKLDRGSRQVKSKCESEVHEAAARDTRAVETVPATPKSESTSRALKRHHLKNISAPATPKGIPKKIWSGTSDCMKNAIFYEMRKDGSSELVFKNNKTKHECPGRLTKGYGSCPTVFLSDDAIRQPDFKTTIRAMTLSIHYIIKTRVGNKSFDIFNERKHPFRHEIITTDHFLRDPELKSVYRFVCTLFSAEHLTAEYAIVTLIFMERLLDCSNIDITPINWRRILLGSALLAYEYWGKQALWGRDYCQLINNIITVDDMNKIEIDFLRLIRFNIQITGRVYARYYFELLMIAEKYNVHDLFEPFCQVEHRTQSLLGAISRGSQEKDLGRAAIERSLSADNVIGMQHTKAILS